MGLTKVVCRGIQIKEPENILPSESPQVDRLGLTKSIAAEDKTPHKSSLALWEPGLGGPNRSGVDKGEGEAVSCETEDGESEPVLDGDVGQHEAHTEHGQSHGLQQDTHCIILPVDSRAYEY